MTEVTEAPRVLTRGTREKSPWAWCTNTPPFSAIDNPAVPARFVVEQVEDAKFRLPDDTGFQYNAPDGTVWVVDRMSLPITDFASIPPFMSWFVSRYGRHTPAVLLHDMRIDDTVETKERRQADTQLRDAMGEIGVPLVRRYVMWAGVTAGTRWSAKGLQRVGLVAWGAIAAMGVALLARGIVTGAAWEIVLALLAPVPASILWGRQWPAGLVGGFAMPVVVGPALASILGFGVYWLIEWAIWRLRLLHPDHTEQTDSPPTAYKER